MRTHLSDFSDLPIPVFQALSGIVTGVIVLIFSAYHIAVVWKDVDFWEKYKTYAESNVDPKPCFDRGDQCLCDDLDDYMKSGYIGKMSYINQKNFG